MKFLKKKRFTKLEFRILLSLIVFFLWTQGVMLMMDVGLMKKAVHGESMFPALRDGDEVIYISTKYKNIKRGDIVSMEVDEKTHYVKRVIGLPNEEIRIEGIDIYIDNKRLEEPYAFYDWVKNSIEKDTLKDKNGTWTLKDGEYFLIGDNRDDSYDSRNFGPVLKEDIIQVVIKIPKIQ